MSCNHARPECANCAGDGRIDVSDPGAGCSPEFVTCGECNGTGEEPLKMCELCSVYIETCGLVTADGQHYCPKCAAVEIDKLWKDNEFLLAEVERLRVLLKETCQAGITLAEGVGHA